MSGQPGGTPAARLRALVVEDEAPLARAIADYLSNDGFDVDIAGDGETAVELVARSRPDVVLLDLMLPGIDGIETCRRIRTFSDAYVVMLTARVGEVDKLVGLSAGAASPGRGPGGVRRSRLAASAISPSTPARARCASASGSWS